MRSFKKLTLLSAALLATTTLANAADILEPPVVEVVPEVTPTISGGWYLRGDIGYSHISTSGVDYYQGSPTLTGKFERHDIGHSWSLGGGIGYQVTDYFRTDWTVTHHFWANFDGSSALNVACSANPAETCDYSDTSKVAVTTLLANAYLDLGNYAGFTPYAGAGVGGAVVHWADLKNVESCSTPGTCTGPFINSTHGGNGNWRFAYALHAGVSYDLTHNLKLDTGYTFTHVDGGSMFDFERGNANSGQQGFDHGLKIHSVHAGLRWSFN